jgi:hypothetical protein
MALPSGVARRQVEASASAVWIEPDEKQRVGRETLALASGVNRKRTDVWGGQILTIGMSRGCRTNQTGCTNLTTADFADVVRAAQAGRAGPPRRKRFTPESSPCRRCTKSRDTRWFTRQPLAEAVVRSDAVKIAKAIVGEDARFPRIARAYVAASRCLAGCERRSLPAGRGRPTSASSRQSGSPPPRYARSPSSS